MLRKMMGSTVVLPENVSFIQNGIQSPLPEHIKGSSILLVYIDSTQCNDCRIRQLNRYDPIIKISETRHTFEVLFLLSVAHNDYESVSKRLVDSDLPYAVAIDRDNAFLRENPNIPSTPVFHTMFLNTMRQPVFVGDPASNQNTYKLFNSIINDI